MSFLPVGLTTSVMSGGRATSSVLCPPVSFLPKVCESVIAQSCPALCNLMACSPLGFSVRGVSQTRIQDPLLQGIFLTQGLNLGLLHCRQILYHPGSLGLSLDKLICQKWYFCFSWAECTFHLRNIWEFRKRLQAGNAVVVAVSLRSCIWLFTTPWAAATVFCVCNPPGLRRCYVWA